MPEGHRSIAPGGPAALCLLLLAGAFASAPAEATTYKCSDADGRLEYRDRPCEDGARTLERIESASGSGGAPAKDAERVAEAGPEAGAEPAFVEAVEPDVVGPVHGDEGERRR